MPAGKGSFKDDQIGLLCASGWVACESVARVVADAGLSDVGPRLLEAFPDDRWQRAEAAVRKLERHFAGVRFADEATYGVLLVPDPGLLDTALPMSPGVRRDQLGAATPDVFDERLPAGRRLAAGGNGGWTMLAGITGRYGISMGSYQDVTSGPAETYTVDCHDTRDLMTRQVWGARVLQAGATPPDCERNDRWTFTLFAGEPLVDGNAQSGTVLKGRVRFRLGKPDRGIGSARVAPMLPCG